MSLPNCLELIECRSAYFKSRKVVLEDGEASSAVGSAPKSRQLDGPPVGSGVREDGFRQQ
jgi:hypothetical protein